MIHLFIGYDAREPIAFSVLAHSILTRASVPVAITPLVQPTLRASGWYRREADPLESTAFSLTRFLVPALTRFRGYSIYMDCDMLCRADLRDLPLPINAAVAVCQHDYTPRAATKFLGHPQTTYPRKNWSSLMVFYGPDCQRLTPEYVNTASPADLHRLAWAPSVEALPLEWNWLVGEYPPNPLAKMLHWTLGGPWFPETRGCDHAKDWRAEYAAMTGAPDGD